MFNIFTHDERDVRAMYTTRASGRVMQGIHKSQLIWEHKEA